jgi:hypothetical protein
MHLGQVVNPLPCQGRRRTAYTGAYTGRNKPRFAGRFESRMRLLRKAPLRPVFLVPRPSVRWGTEGYGGAEALRCTIGTQLAHGLPRLEVARSELLCPKGEHLFVTSQGPAFTVAFALRLTLAIDHRRLCDWAMRQKGRGEGQPPATAARTRQGRAWRTRQSSGLGL